jgi:hypothetical protein
VVESGALAKAMPEPEGIQTVFKIPVMSRFETVFPWRKIIVLLVLVTDTELIAKLGAKSTVLFTPLTVTETPLTPWIK